MGRGGRGRWKKRGKMGRDVNGDGGQRGLHGMKGEFRVYSHSSSHNTVVSRKCRHNLPRHIYRDIYVFVIVEHVFGCVCTQIGTQICTEIGTHIFPKHVPKWQPTCHSRSITMSSIVVCALVYSEIPLHSGLCIGHVGKRGMPC